ncbi:Ku protein [Streptomyces sp. DSM 42041]|uniref:Non-homologous end joining protein Ku n=1 Tax=Streptomyces hazeniae TaxID=3075538 RepID=A0ABU2NK53_9ACTN|nr:Ku protein [Streptomyces sp. DSM 42041]MDT0377366.1 Ku protein [Streptomyces sp. DSM 42041]
MRSIWKGAISFGLVSIPIKVVSATESHGVSFRQVHTTDGGRIRYRKVCELDGEEVPSEEIGKAYETVDGSHVEITDDDLAALPLPTAKTVEILGFLPAEDIDPIRLDRSYFLTGDGQSAAKPYVLLREALARSGRVAVAKLALRNRESLGMLRVYQDTLTLHTMLWPDEVRSADGMAPGENVSVRDQELDLADALMETLGELDLDELHDEYREALEAMVDAKEAGEPLPVGAPAPREGKVVDLMSVLENSVQAARQSRGEDDGEAEVHQLPQKKTASSKAAKKAPAKKSTASRKSTAAEKSTAKKTAKKTSKTTAKKTAKKTTATKRSPRKSA